MIDDPEFATIRNDPRWLKFLQKTDRAPEQLAAIKFDPPELVKVVASTR